MYWKEIVEVEKRGLETCIREKERSNIRMNRRKSVLREL